MNHGEVAAAILRPFISEANRWMLAHHGLFQTYFYGEHLGLDPDAREAYRDHRHYQRTVDFTSRWDEVSFDPDYPSEPMSTFEPMVRRVLAARWEPPAAAPSDLRAIWAGEHPGTGERLGGFPNRQVAGFGLRFRPPKPVSRSAPSGSPDG